MELVLLQWFYLVGLGVSGARKNCGSGDLIVGIRFASCGSMDDGVIGFGVPC